MQSLLNSLGCSSQQIGGKEAGICRSVQWGWQVLWRPKVNALLLTGQSPVHLQSTAQMLHS